MHIGLLLCSTAFLAFVSSSTSLAFDPADPESVIRALVRANAEKDMATLSRYMAHDADIVSYTIGGRKYVGWSDLERDFQEEFSTVAKLEIPIQELRVWTKGDVSWFTMELDYVRYLGARTAERKMVLQLRESGVLQKEDGQWRLHSWHESPRTVSLSAVAAVAAPAAGTRVSERVGSRNGAADLSGEWDIVEPENDKHYKATLDPSGNGPYSQHGGRFVTTGFADRLWQGTWHQPGNDREGGFELLLTEDGTEAKGIWWYTRVGKQKNIPPREHGGTYEWKRLTPPPPSP
jgi:ketosteroid isomerase-like protein